jgi:hypothetical protein
MAMKNVCVLAIGALLLVGRDSAMAQGALTGSLPEGEPPVSSYRVGPVYLSPNVALRELGVDDNVFDDAEEPQRDFMLVLAPDVSAYVRSGLLQVVLLSSTELTYYKKFQSQRSVARQFRVRSDFLLSRFRPSIAAALVDSRSRPNQEIDLRARRSDREVSGSIAFEVSPLARAYVGAAHVETEFGVGETFRFVALDQTLNRRNDSVQAGVRFALTPFTTLTVEGQVATDKFVFTPERNSESRAGTAAITFGSEAVVVGTVRVGYRNFQPVDASLPAFNGLVTSGGLSYLGFWRGRIAGTLERDVQYSFDDDDGYFIGTAGELTYTQRVAGPFDLQVRAARGALDYADVLTNEGRHDTTRTYAAGIGYNRDRGARLGLTYEQSRRDSAARPDRRYTRRKVYATLTYGF